MLEGVDRSPPRDWSHWKANVSIWRPNCPYGSPKLSISITSTITKAKLPAIQQKTALFRANWSRPYQFRILQLDIEGISQDKSEYLVIFARENSLLSVLLLQETHNTDTDQLRQRGSISGYFLAAVTYDRRYGTSTYICM